MFKVRWHWTDKQVMRSPPGKLSSLVLAVCVATVLMAFQNCSDMGAMSAASNSVLCRSGEAAKISAQLKGVDLRCDDMNNYQCERRLFSPTAAGLTHSLKECVGHAGDICVDVDVREFNTESARSRATQGAFLPGGEYNREEVRCHHRLALTKDAAAVVVGEGDSLEEALAHVISACEHVGESGP